MWLLIQVAYPGNLSGLWDSGLCWFDRDRRTGVPGVWDFPLTVYQKRLYVDIILED